MQVASETHDYTTSALYNAAIEADSAYWCDPYMDVDGAQMMLLSPLDGIVHQLPSLRQLIACLVPELHLVNRQAHKVEA